MAARCAAEPAPRRSHSPAEQQPQSTQRSLLPWTISRSPAGLRPDARLPVRAALSQTGCNGSPPRQPWTTPSRVEWSSSGEAEPGEGKLASTKHLFPSLCFAPSVSLYGFLPERNRPPPRLRVFPWLPAWALGGRGSAASRRTPFLDCPGKPGRASPGGKLEWPQAGRRQGGQAHRAVMDVVGEPSGVNRRDDATEGRLGGGRKRVVGPERGGVGHRWGSSGSCLSALGVGRDGAAVCCCRLSSLCHRSSSVISRSLPPAEARPGSRAAASAPLSAPELTPAHVLARRRFRGGSVSRPAGLSKSRGL
jgi:hypothetical protein